MESLFSLILIGAFMALLVISFGIQFYVGNHLYGSNRAGILRSLNGAKTFIRGWRDPSLRAVMIIWSGIAGVVLVGLCFLVAAVGLNR